MSRDNFKDYCLKNYLDELKSKAITNLCNKNKNEYNIYKANYMRQHNNINDEEIIKYNFIKSKNFRDEVFDEEINNIIDNEYNDIKQISPKTKPKRSFTDDYRDYYYIEDNEDEKDTEKKSIRFWINIVNIILIRISMKMYGIGVMEIKTYVLII